MEQCQCINQFDTIGIIYSKNITPINLGQAVVDFQEEFSIDFNRKLIALNSMDAEYAQKYGQFRELELSKKVSTISPRIINFYYDYYKTTEESYKELLEYIYDMQGLLIVFLNDKCDKLLSWQEEYLDKYKIDIVSYYPLPQLPPYEKLNYVKRIKLY